MSELTTMDDALLASFGFGEGTTIKPTNLTLIQKVNEQDQVAGEFFDFTTKFSYPNMKVIVLKVTKGKKFKGPDDKVLCRAVPVAFNAKPDTLFPITNNPELFPQDKGKGCAKCEHNQWLKINGKSIKPECADQYTILMVDVDTGIPYKYYAGGTAINPVKDYVETVGKAVMIGKAKGAKVNHLNFQTTLTSSFIKQPKMSWYVPSFSRVQPTNPDAYDNALTMFQRFAVRTEEVEEEDVVAKAVNNSSVNEEETAFIDV